MLARSIQKHVEEHKARHKWLKGGMSIRNQNILLVRPANTWLWQGLNSSM